jgi:hypothetical protein
LERGSPRHRPFQSLRFYEICILISVLEAYCGIRYLRRHAGRAGRSSFKAK